MRRPKAGLQSKGSDRGISMTSRAPRTQGALPGLHFREGEAEVAGLFQGLQVSILMQLRDVEPKEARARQHGTHIALFADCCCCLSQCYLLELNPGLLRDRQKY